MSERFLELKDVTVNRNNTKLIDAISFAMHYHEHWAITGHSGSGKTILAETIAGKHFHSGQILFFGKKENESISIAYVEQLHRFKNVFNLPDFYYQQRFNSYDAEQTITVREELNKFNLSGDWIRTLHLEPVLEKPLIQLSNGENKRLQLAEALSTTPHLLILDNPFSGLDTEGRETLHKVLNQLANQGIHLLVITSPDEIPGSITHIVRMQKGKIAGIEQNGAIRSPAQDKYDKNKFQLEPLNTVSPAIEEKFEYAVRMINVNVQYGKTSVLANINWHVRKGEAWGVTGPNGAGKSTLLSLINADNPKAYANEIYLFDKRRGTGESIWEIKKRTGYVSPELHLYFNFYATTFEVIASGLFDTIGLFRQLSEQEEIRVFEWMKILRVEHLGAKNLSGLSTGQQRMALLARALIKNPPLLLLDEPCQGLDAQQIFLFRQLVDDVYKTFGTTIIYVTHYSGEFPDCVNHYLKLENGRVVYAGN